MKAHTPDLRATDYHRLAARNEVRSVVHDAELFCRTSLDRKEPRGWHIREDYPERDDSELPEWMILKENRAKSAVSTERVSLERSSHRP